jgi:hypothetical protein
MKEKTDVRQGKQLQAETRGWEQTAAIMGRFFVVKSGRSEMRRP